MLNKDACKKCHEECGELWDEDVEEEFDTMGYIWCPIGEHTIALGKYTEPTDKCKYKLEHMVMNDVDKRDMHKV